MGYLDLRTKAMPENHEDFNKVILEMVYLSQGYFAE
jgi:hypothetical protein